MQKVEYVGTEGASFQLLIEARQAILNLNHQLQKVDMEINREEWLNLLDKKYSVYCVIKDLLQRELRSAEYFIEGADRTRVDLMLSKKDTLQTLLKEK